MISRRDFLQATAAASALLTGSGLGSLGRVAAQQRLTQADILKFDPLGTVTILYIADTHAQLMPLYFREPSVNLGVGEDRGLPPHITDEAFRKYFHIAAGSADAYALTADDFAREARRDARQPVTRARAGEHVERRRERQSGLQQACKLTREARDVSCAGRWRPCRATYVECQHRDAVARECRARRGRIERDDGSAASRTVASTAAPREAGFVWRRAHGD